MSGALICEEFLRDLEQLFKAEDEELLRLSQAARRSGYSEEHLGRLLREGKLPNAGRKGSPRIRSGDLPKKAPSALADHGPKLYDPETDARALSSAQRKGAWHG